MSDRVDECLRIACCVQSSAVKIYNLIREVGYKKLSADNALHQMVEEYHNLKVVGDRLTNLAKILKEEGGEK